MSAPLDKLHDFYQPPPPSWMPRTVGWYVVFAVLGLCLLWAATYAIRKWFVNRYRREALRDLPAVPVTQLSTLLKGTALVAWPRTTVASLSGEKWLAFLDRTAGKRLFRDAPGNRIEEIELTAAPVSSDEERRLRELAGEWIRRHRVSA